MESKTLGVVGAGSWGTALSHVLGSKGYQVDLWVYEEELCALLKKTRENTLYLPGFQLSENIRFTHSLEQAVGDKSVILLVVPTHVMRETLIRMKPFVRPGCLFINASKGIENETLYTIHQIVKEILPSPMGLAAVSGPTFAAEIAKGAPSAMVAGAENLETAERVQEIFSTPRLKVFTSTDLPGVEFGGALKNVIAIATGISDGLEMGYNARAALITRGLVEITRIATTQGARPETLSGLSGMGDLVLTCTGELSRNRNVGIQLGRGKKLQEITQNMKMVAEGIRTVKSAYMLKNKLDIQASVVEETYRVLYEDKPPQKAVEDLMKVKISTEFAGIKGLE